MTADALFDRAPPEVAAVCRDLRALVRDVLPESEEIVFPGWNNVSYGTGASRADHDLICYVAPYARHANLGLYRGAALPDPAGLMTGAGRRLRHIRVRPGAVPDADALRALLLAARRERLG